MTIGKVFKFSFGYKRVIRINLSDPPEAPTPDPYMIIFPDYYRLPTG
jgi:hypothetical protein